MPQRISFDGQIHEFPDDFTDADIASALGGGSSSAPDNGPHISAAPPPPSDTAGTGLGMFLRALGSAPVTSTISAAADALPLAGAFKGPLGYLGGQLAKPAIKAATNSVLPAVAKAVSGPMAGALNIGDLAQMAEPNRRDIGILGIGAHEPSAAEAAYRKEHPPIINKLLQMLLGQ